MARDNRIDSIKGLLIILVILGHLIIALDNYNFINHCVMGLIYIFHMPLFILISGYVTKHPESQQPRDMWKTVGNIMVTLIIFQFISSLRIYLYHGDVLSSLKGFPFGILWYLFSLICWRIMLYYTPKALLNRPLLYLIIAIAVSMLSGVFHLGTFLSVQRTLNFYFFFLLGFYYRQGVFNTPLWHNNKLHIAVLVVMMPLLLWLFPRCGNVMNGADYYGIAGLPQKAMVLMCSIPMTLLMFNIIPDIKVLRPIGKDSLFYYLYHMLFLAIVTGPLVKSYGLPRTLPFILLYTAFTLLALVVLHKIPFFRWLIHPTFKKRAKDANS
jgi:fucose 4-O-acetylase-like acetyltransferase